MRPRRCIPSPQMKLTRHFAERTILILQPARRVDAILLENLPRKIRAARWIAGILILCSIGGLSSAQTETQTQSKAPAEPSSQTSPNILPSLQLNEDDALRHLNQVISWYRHSTTSLQGVGLPTDAIYKDNAQSLG